MTESSQDNNYNNNRWSKPLELTQEIEQTGVVDGFYFNVFNNEIVVNLNHVYKRTKAIVTVDRKNWTTTIKRFLKALEDKGVSDVHSNQLRDVLDNNHDLILDTIFSAKEQGIDVEEDNRSSVQKAFEFAEEKVQKLFTDQFGVAYAVIDIDGHYETLSLTSPRFRSWLSKTYHQESGNRDILAAEAVTNAINLLIANAEFDGHSIKLDLRVATDPDDPFTIYYDLTNKDWEVVKITPNDWQIVGGKDTPTVFRRIFGNQQPQVYPSASHDYPDDILYKYISLFHLKTDDKENRLLLECYIISLFFPDVAKAILMLHGDPGSAKSTKQTLIRRTVDPSSLDTVAFSKDKDQLNQKLDHNYICYFDNVSEISDEISDMLCRAATSAGDSKRRLYTDNEDYITNYIRCIGFNGINLAANKPDLLDRGLIIETERIDDPKEEREIYEKLDQIKPQLLAYIFDLMVEVLKYKQTVDLKLTKLPRMAGFAKLSEVIARCIGYDDNEFINAYKNNIKLQNDRVFEANIISSAIIELTKLEPNKQWKGTTTELLARLNEIAESNLSIDIKSRGWPKSPSKLSEKLNLIKINLKSVGITINRYYEDRKKTKKLIEIIVNDASDASANTSADQNRAQNTSDIADGTNNDDASAPNVPSANTPQNRAQYQGADDADDADGTFTHSHGDSIENSDPYFGDDPNYITEEYVCLRCEGRKIKGDTHLPTFHDCTCENQEVIEQ